MGKPKKTETKNPPKQATKQHRRHAPIPSKGKSPHSLNSSSRSAQKLKASKKGRGNKILLFFAIGICALGLGFFYLIYDLPSLRYLSQQTRPPKIELLYADGSPLATFGSDYGKALTLDQLPAYVSQAVIATEDRRFYQHTGLDLIGVLRAIFVNINAGKVKQGGSTLTQQLAKNFLLSAHLYTPENRSFKRKAQEILMALWLEKQFTKDQILTLYLNRVYLGAGVYGVNAAAQKYFQKPASQLTLLESAILAGALKAPSRYAPASFSWPRILKRATVVLESMVECAYITKKEKEEALKSSKITYQHDPKPSSRFFADWVVDQLSYLLPAIENDIQVITTLNPSLQQRAEKVVDYFLKIREQKYLSEEMALLSLDPSGAVRALVGGSAYWHSPYNRAVWAHRQAGSVFKTFVYLEAFEKGWAPDTLILDAPLKLRSWAPKNYSQKYRGEITLKDAFAYSSNTAVVRLAQQVGVEAIRDLCYRLGLHSELAQDLTIALGSTSVTLVELTSAFHTIWQNGNVTKPYTIYSIRRLQDQVLIYQHKPQLEAGVVSPQACQHMQTLLKAVTTYGTAKRLAFLGASGKTGTSQKYRDAWFVGYTPELLTGIWVGNDDNRPTEGITGGSLPLQLWEHFYTP